MPTIRDKTSNTASGVSITITVPPSTVDGDLMILALASDQTPTITTPAGWTLRHQGLGSAGGGNELAIYERIASSEPATFTVTTTYEDFTWSCYAIQDHNGINASAINAEQVASDPNDAPSVVTTVDGCLILHFGSWDRNVVITVPTGTTEEFNLVYSSRVTGAGSSSTQATAGATGVATFTGNTTNEQWIAATLAIAPSGGGGGGSNVGAALHQHLLNLGAR